MPSVLFVCTANRFRSPLAAAAMRRKIVEQGDQGSYHIASAGTWTVSGLPATSAALLAAQQAGLDLVGHFSVPVDAVTLEAYDLILVMEAGHKEALVYEFPMVSKRVHLLSEVVDGLAYDIPDAASDEEALEIASDLTGLIERGYERICQLAVSLQRKNL